MFLWFWFRHFLYYGDECKESFKKSWNSVTVEHSTIDDVVPGAADLFICSADLVQNAEKAGRAIGLNNMVNVSEIQEKLKKAFEED